MLLKPIDITCPKCTWKFFSTLPNGKEASDLMNETETCQVGVRQCPRCKASFDLTEEDGTKNFKYLKSEVDQQEKKPWYKRLFSI